jgi:Ran GTPase-activating protein (RanGAP) involved in mRNA processing and transport
MKEDFKTNASPEEQYLQESEEVHWVKLLKNSEKLRAIFIRSCHLSDKDISGLTKVLETNQTLKVLDISSNKVSNACVESFCGLLDKNKTIEFIGLAKSNLSYEDVAPLLDRLGKKPFPGDQVDAHLKKMKDRDAVIEKNKKAKPGAPKDIVPPIDTIVQEGTAWTLL